MRSLELEQQLQNIQNLGRSVMSVYEFTTQGLRRLVGDKQEDLGDQVENFIDFEQGLDWTFRVVGHEDKRQTTEGLTQA
jgi:hypothetical protein